MLCHTYTPVGDWKRLRFHLLSRSNSLKGVDNSSTAWDWRLTPRCAGFQPLHLSWLSGFIPSTNCTRTCTLSSTMGGSPIIMNHPRTDCFHNRWRPSTMALPPAKWSRWSPKVDCFSTVSCRRGWETNLLGHCVLATATGWGQSKLVGGCWWFDGHLVYFPNIWDGWFMDTHICGMGYKQKPAKVHNWDKQQRVEWNIAILAAISRICVNTKMHEIPKQIYQMWVSW